MEYSRKDEKMQGNSMVRYGFLAALMALLPLGQAQAFDVQIDWRKDAHKAPVNAVAFSDDGRLVGSAGNDNWLRLFHAADGVEFRALKLKDLGEMLPTPQKFAPAVSLEPSPGAPAMSTHPFLYGFHDISFAVGLPLVASAFTVKYKDDYDNIAHTAGFVLIWNYQTDDRRLVPIFEEEGGSKCTPLRAVEFSPNGEMLACAGDNGSLTLIDALNGRKFYSVTTPAEAVSAMAFSADGRLLASGGKENVTLYDARTGLELQQYDNGKQRPHVLAFSPDGHQLYSGGYDSKLRVFNTAGGEEIAIMKEFESCVRGVVFTADGKLAIAAALDRKLRFYQTSDYTELDVFGAIEERHNALAMSPDGRYMMLGTMSGALLKLTLPFSMNPRSVSLFDNGATPAAAATDFSSDQHMFVGPNPADQATAIEWRLDGAARVKLEIHNAFGEIVAVLADERLSAGDHLRRWNIGEAPSGVYYARLSVDGHKTVRKVVVNH